MFLLEVTPTFTGIDGSYIDRFVLNPDKDGETLITLVSAKIVLEPLQLIALPAGRSYIVGGLIGVQTGAVVKWGMDAGATGQCSIDLIQGGLYRACVDDEIDVYFSSVGTGLMLDVEIQLVYDVSAVSQVEVVQRRAAGVFGFI